MRAALIAAVATLVVGAARADDSLRVGAWSMSLPLGLPAAAAQWPAAGQPRPQGLETCSTGASGGPQRIGRRQPCRPAGGIKTGQGPDDQ